MSSLNDSEKRYRTLFDQSPDGILLIDASGKIIDFNEAAHRQLGYSREEFEKLTLTDINPLEDAELIMSRIRDITTIGEADFEVRHKTKSGDMRNVRVITRLITLSGRDVFHSIWRDITESKMVEERLEKLVGERTAELQIAISFLSDEIAARMKAEETLRESEVRARHIHGVKLIGEMAAAVAHEVRNPLHALMSVTEALRQELSDNAELDIYIHHINRQVERLSSLMKDLLDLGKPVEPANLHRESLVEICSAAIEQWKNMPMGFDRKVALVMPKERAEIFITADSQKLQQVVLNLLDNAAQHSPKDGEIGVIIEGMAGDIVRFRVVDRGTGIPEELLPKVLVPFFSTRKGGTGLGLNIVKNIIESHGGSISLSNNAGHRGCTVDVTMPCAEEVVR